MRKFHGLEKLRTNQQGLVNLHHLAQWLMIDLAESQMIIYGGQEGEKRLLAVLPLQPDSLNYHHSATAFASRL